MRPRILHEDHEILLLDKPPGWVVTSAATTASTKTVQDWLRESFKYPLSEDIGARSGLVHRLDKETSGVLVVAKTREAFLDLQAQFKKRITEKVYIALVHGVIDENGEVNAPVGRLPWNRKRFGVLAGGREAYTRYEIFQNFNGYTLLSVSPRTGRTHQIRVHMRHIGHAIVSDELYAGRKTARADRQWCPRLFLHAKSLSLLHPHTGERVEFSSPLPADLKLALKALEMRN